MPIFKPNRSAREIGEDSYLKNVLWLVHNGIPFELAFELEPNELYGMAVIFSEFVSGKKFDWNSCQWENDD